MIKLINQFDNEKSKISLATPTCGCCCCCCCCLISSVAVSSISARNFGKFVAQDDKEQENKKRYPAGAMVFGFIAPAAGALFVIVAYLIFGEITSGYNPYIAGYVPWLVGSLAYLIIMFAVLNKSGKKLGGLIGRTIGFAIVLGVSFVAEMLGVIWALDANLGYVYLFGAIIIDIFLFILMLRPKYKNNYIESNNNAVETQSDIFDLTLAINDSENESIEKIVNEQVIQKEETPKSKKKCPKCGTDNGEESKFCLICTTPFEDVKSKSDNGENN